MSLPRVNPMFKRTEVECLPCAKCSEPMRVSLIEPADQGFELRTYGCPKCNTSESFHVAI